jgi:6,7-dimethyl-8-ribityllumazine synthase
VRVDDRNPLDLDATGLRVAVVTAMFNAAVTTGLKNGAVDYLEEASASEIMTIDAPGAFELPLIAQKLALAGYDAIVCLGAVIEGETDHYEHVANRASEGLMRVQLDTGVPVAFGILTVRTRAAPGPDNKGREAAIAAVMAVRALEAID